MIWLALARQVADHALGVGALGHVFDEGGLHACAQRGLDGLAALVVLLRPAGLGDRRDIDKAGLDGFTGAGLGCEKTGREKQTAASAKAPAGTRFLYMVFLYMAPDD
jgi:hypothetical protein